MTSTIGDFVGLHPQLFRLSLGETLAALARQRYPRDTAKRIARAWNIDPKTAANVLLGHASERTLTKALRAEGWALIAALGEVITGETFAQFEERRLQAIINEAENARQNLVELRARRAQLESRAGQLDASRDWGSPKRQRDGHG
jgi:hypothetical protein